MIYWNTKEVNTESALGDSTGTVVTFGKFDGLHKGHCLLLQKAIQIAKERNLKVLVCTFDMRNWKSGKADQSYKLTTSYERRMICEEYGVDILYEYPFDDDMAGTDPREFLESFVCRSLCAKAVVVGDDWHFGSRRGGDIHMLCDCQAEYGYEAFIVNKEVCKGREISSSWIREELRAGNMEEVYNLLGYAYHIRGFVKHGYGLGQKIECPTINLIPEPDKALPPFGVYTSLIQIGGRDFFGITNVGVRPTVSETGRVSVETNILDFDADIYGEELTVSLLQFVRPEMRFDDVNALKQQLLKDIRFARDYFAGCTENA